MSLGGYHNSPPEVQAEIANIVNTHVGDINSKLGTNYTNLTVHSAYHQIVAGKNYWVHIRAPDGRKLSIKIYVGLDGKSELADVHEDHINPQ